MGGGGIASVLKSADLGSMGNLISGALGGLGGGSILGMLGGAGAGAAVGDAAGGGMLGSLIGSAVGGGAGGAILTGIAGNDHQQNEGLTLPRSCVKEEFNLHLITRKLLLANLQIAIVPGYCVSAKLPL